MLFSLVRAVHTAWSVFEQQSPMAVSNVLAAFGHGLLTLTGLRRPRQLPERTGQYVRQDTGPGAQNAGHSLAVLLPRCMTLARRLVSAGLSFVLGKRGPCMPSPLIPQIFSRHLLCGKHSTVPLHGYGEDKTRSCVKC